MSNQPPPKPTQPKTDAQLARLLGVNRAAIAMHRKRHKDCPPGQDVSAWKAYLAAVGREGSTPEEVHLAIAMRKLSILESKDETEKDELLKLRRELIYWKDVQAILSELILLHYWGEFDRLIQELPPKLAGMKEHEIFTYLRREKDKIKKKLFDRVYEWMKIKGPKQ